MCYTIRRSTATRDSSRLRVANREIFTPKCRPRGCDDVSCKSVAPNHRMNSHKCDRQQIRRIDSAAMLMERLSDTTASQSVHEMHCRQGVNFAFNERRLILEMLTGENQHLMLGRNIGCQFNLGLNFGNRITRINVERQIIAIHHSDCDLHWQD